MATYIALLRKDPDSHYGVEFPDFPGCVTAGVTLEEAGRMAKEALELHLEGLLEDLVEIPEPSSLDEVAAHPASAGAVAVLVEVADPNGPSRRVNITLPESVLRRIDEAADRARESRSAFLATAAMQRIRKAG
jgi:predicted RNase H-like HicB family nuclease